MPPVTAASRVSLRELADLAIGTPEVGAVNFTVLHTLIVAMLKNLHLQDTVVDFRSLSPEQSQSFESLRTLRSASQLPVPKETPSKEVALKEKRKSIMARMPAQTLESQVKDLGGQVQDLSRQFKTMDSQMQDIMTHVQSITRLDVDTEERLEEQEMAMPVPEMSKLMPGMAVPVMEMAKPMPEVAKSKSGMDMPRPETTKPMLEARMQPGMATPLPEVTTLMPQMVTPMPRMVTPMSEKARMGLMKIRKDGPQVSTWGPSKWLSSPGWT